MGRRRARVASLRRLVVVVTLEVLVVVVVTIAMLLRVIVVHLRTGSVLLVTWVAITSHVVHWRINDQLYGECLVW